MRHPPIESAVIPSFCTSDAVLTRNRAATRVDHYLADLDTSHLPADEVARVRAQAIEAIESEST